MKKTISTLIVLLALAVTSFGQSQYTYCDSVFVTFGTTVTGSSVKFSPTITTTTKPSPKVIAQEWGFGDGTGASTMDPTHDYGKPGAWQPCFTVKIANPRDANHPCIIKYCGSVTIKDPCADFNSAVTGHITLGSNGVATFEASMSNNSGNSFTYSWDFGDKSTSADRTGTHTYGAGTWKPCVTITSSNPQCTKTICFDAITVTGTDPCANFNPAAHITLGTNGVASFESAMSNSNTNTFTYTWDFGDNTTSGDRVGNHTYKPGTYHPCVTITSSDPKCSKKICFDAITVTSSDPCAEFNAKTEAGITIDGKGLATYKSTWNSAYTYSWTFGDGTSSSTSDGTHQYYHTGTYKVCVTITFTVGGVKCSKTICNEITYKGQDPCADFNPRFEFKIGDNGVVSFWGVGTTTSTYSYVWNFGDGSSGTGIQTSHSYKPGSWKPCVTIYDSKTGCKKTVCVEITITSTNSDPCKDFNPTFNYKIDGTLIVFEGQSGADLTYNWWFSNNTTSTDRIVKIDFSKPGTYRACVKITNTKTKCSKTICKDIVIQAKETQDPCKNFNPKVSFQTNGLKVILAVEGGKGSTMLWDFGDGTKGSQDASVTHVYAKSGKYTICVSVYDTKHRCKKTICFTIGVEGKTEDPCINFKPEFSFSVTGNKIVVEGTNLTGVQYSWAWGDKQTSTGRVSDHTFTTSGYYTICMTAYDPNTGCKKTICKTIPIGSQKMIGQSNDGKDGLLVYPNPADTKISVVTLTDSEAKISITDVYGVEVMRYDATPNQDKSIDMIINELQKGTYYINVEQDGKIQTTKFVK